MVSNFWRATKYDPEAVAYWADDPVCEVTLHAIHRWLVLGDEAAAFRKRMREDPDYYDVKRAGRWCAGLCEWIGSGWCSVPELRADGTPREKLPGQIGGRDARGVNAEARLPQQAPHLGGNHDHGRGVNAGLPQKLPTAEMCRTGGKGVHGVGPEGGRPQLADAYALGRGVHAGPGPAQKRPVLGGGTEAGCSGPSGVIAKSGGGTCAARRAWLLDWFGRLRDRLRCVRVCCGHWLRVCDSESVTTRLGVTGLFLDPPYPSHGSGGEESRDGSLYATDAGRDALDALRDEVLAYCRERGPDPRMRLAVCGYDTDGYASLVKEGWEEVAWRAAGGYGNRSAKGRANRGRERIWFSPHCERAAQRGLFDALQPEAP
jgi:DNA adenine methylase